MNLHAKGSVAALLALPLLSLLYLAPAVIGAGTLTAAQPQTTAHQTTPNRLLDSGSPYLLQHAYNPVDWYPWGREALDRAKRENKPIFLSVGYSTCYWCHVANETLYANPEIAALMNRWFINIKVDREQRPDIDRVYMQATLLMTQRAGWPNNLFLTPDLKPFFAGTYFPPVGDEFGRPGFATILQRLHGAWEDQRAEVIASAEQIHARLRETVKRSTANADQPVDIARWRQTARTVLRYEFDSEHGGLRTQSGSKFPLGPVLEFLLAESRVPQADKTARTKPARMQLAKTLDAIAFGGIHDQVDGGFYRYAVEPTWSVPHFEKMLYDNAQLLRIYAQAYEITGNAAYKAVAERTAEWLLAGLGAPGGGFFTALDASVAGKEGLSYIWSRAQIEALLGPQAAQRYFDAFELKPVEPRHRDGDSALEEPGVLRLRLPLAQTLKRTKQRDVARLFSSYAPLQAELLAARNQRQQPARDEKLLVGLNGLAIEAYAITGRILGNPIYLETARRAADQMWSSAYASGSGRLFHQIFRGRAQTDGFLEDYALLGRGLMALHTVTREPVWRQRAALLADAIRRDFLRPDGSLATTRDQADLLVSADDIDDQSYPSGTSAALDLLLQLSAGNQRSHHGRAAQTVLAAMSASLHQAPQAWPSMLAALSRSGTATATAPTTARGIRERSDQTAGDDLPGTAEKLTIAARIGKGKERDEVTVALAIKPGWHINANPASFGYLIPTSIVFDGVKPRSVRYPEAIRFMARFTQTAIDVYEGKVRVVALFAKGVLPRKSSLRATLTTQACDDSVCLPPATIAFSVPPS